MLSCDTAYLVRIEPSQLCSLEETKWVMPMRCSRVSRSDASPPWAMAVCVAIALDGRQAIYYSD